MQRSKLLLPLFLVLLDLFVFSQVHASNRIVVSNTKDYISLGNGIAFMRDKQASLTLAEILEQDIPFDTFNGSVLNFENSTDRIWLKFDLENQTQQELFLQFGNPELDEIACYGVADDQILWQQESGAKRPFTTRYMMSNKVSLSLGTQSCTVYIAVQTRSGIYLPMYVGSIKSLSDINHKDDLFNGAYIGIMLIMLFYNLFVFISVRDKVYLQYCLYLLSSTIMMLFIKGLQFDLFWREHFTINSFYFTNITVAFTTALAACTILLPSLLFPS